MQNPNAALQMLAQQNPMIQQAQQIAAQYGGDYNKAFVGLCQQYGYDPNEIMAQIQSQL
jgi:hypothetical protein